MMLIITSCLAPHINHNAASCQTYVSHVFPLQVYNFSAGPAILPLEVLEQAQSECLNFNGSGMSVMEMSHRSKAFDGIIKAAEADLRQLLSIPDNYKVLFVQGGASTQFAAIPLNFTQDGGCVRGASSDHVCGCEDLTQAFQPAQTHLCCQL
jgi:phosphoserine aminotransferase